MSLKYEPASEPLHIYVKYFFLHSHSEIPSCGLAGSRRGSVEAPPPKEVEGGVLEATITVLQTCGVFVKMERATAEKIAGVVQYSEYNEDQTIFAEGEAGDFVYGVLAGQVKMISRDVNAVSAALIPRNQVWDCGFVFQGLGPARYGCSYETRVVVSMKR